MYEKKMLLSSRKEPPRHLALHKSTHAISFKQYLLHSPLPSPALPAILPRHGKKPPRLNPHKIVRCLCWLGIFASVRVILQHLFPPTYENEIWVKQASYDPSLVVIHRDQIPKNASPVILQDQYGKLRWTVSIPSDQEGPLAGSEYAQLCENAIALSASVAEGHHSRRESGYADWDSYYVDISDAKSALLLSSTSSSPILSKSPLPQCERSLTYVLDNSHAGLGEALLGLWISYGLAKKESRVFFLDDSDFTYGGYTTLFSPIVQDTSCQPPSWDQRTPYPRKAKHLIISPSTHQYSFDNAFHSHFSASQIYQLARIGYEALFKLREDDGTFVQNRLTELRGSVTDDSTNQRGALIGIHMRRGDRHPFEYQHQHGYLPPSRYLLAAQDAAKTYSPHKTSILLASDDADIYQHPELEHTTTRAQKHIRLASKKQLGKKGLGWEGGFFTDSFWNIGIPEEIQIRLKHSISKAQPTKTPQSSDQLTSSQHDKNKETTSEIQRDYSKNPTPEALQLREYIGRAYLLDLAVLAGSDEIICAVSSYGCRILGVMMGWEKVTRKKWKNVDAEEFFPDWFAF